MTITAADLEALGVTGKPQTGRIGYMEFVDQGIYQVPREPGDRLGFVSLEAFRKDPANNR